MDDEGQRARVEVNSDGDTASDVELMSFDPFAPDFKEKLAAAKKERTAKAKAKRAAGPSPKMRRPAAKKKMTTKTKAKRAIGPSAQTRRPAAKKKPRKNKMDDFYPVVRNFQGIDIAYCRHHPAESRGKVFMPDQYGPPPRSKKLFTDYCAECCLQPCCMEEFSEKIRDEASRLRGFERFRNTTIRGALEGYIHKWLEGVFPPPYCKRLKKATPSCITAKLLEDHPDSEDSPCVPYSDEEEAVEEEEAVL